jgi:pimeloyl-ACP methyl ester carboxylesterase
MTLPEKPKDGSKVPVVMFGHGLMTDRRFVLMLAGTLAQKGFAAVSFDFPFHGERTRCTEKTLVAIPNFFPEDVRKLSSSLQGDLLSFPPCGSGATCNVEGKCANASGVAEDYATIPLTDMPVAGGSALIDVEDIPHISDRMEQALIDMKAMRRALRLADWSKVTGGIALETHRVFYTGQSLGGILGAVFVATSDDVARAVLNVPGADLVGLFRESTYFAPQMDAFLEHEKLVEGSYRRERLLAVARWLMDAVDPHSLAQLLGKRAVLLQMDKGDIVIPNRVTERLQRASKLPMKTYPSPMHGDLVMPVIGDAMLGDLVDFLVAGK